MKERAGEDFADFTLTHLLGETKRTLALFQEVKVYEESDHYDRTLETYRILHDLLEQAVSPELDEAAIIKSIERTVRQMVPYLGEQFVNYLTDAHHKLLPDEAPSELQRLLSLVCANAMRMQLKEARVVRKAAYMLQDAVADYEDAGETEVVDFTLSHVFAATKRWLLYRHRKKDKTAEDREQYEDTLAIHHLLKTGI